MSSLTFVSFFLVRKNSIGIVTRVENNEQIALYLWQDLTAGNSRKISY